MTWVGKTWSWDTDCTKDRKSLWCSKTHLLHPSTGENTNVSWRTQTVVQLDQGAFGKSNSWVPTRIRNGAGNWSALDMLILTEKVLCGTELKGNAAFIILVLMIHSTSIHQFIISSTSIHNNLYMMSSGEDKRNCRPDFWPIPITPTTRPVPQLFAHILVFTLFYSLWHWPGGENDCRLGANWDNLVNCICIPAGCRGCC